MRSATDPIQVPGYPPGVPLDPAAAAALETIELIPPSLQLADLEEVRAVGARRVLSFEEMVGRRPVRIREFVVAGNPDVEVSVLEPIQGRRPLPCVVFAHGGGLMFGSRFFEGDALVDLAEEHGVVVVAVEYRLAPENPYPAALDDCMASLDWVVQNAALLGVDPKRILVGGRSAGGHLAAAMALRARDEARHRLAGQLLIYPMLDNLTVAEPGS